MRKAVIQKRLTNASLIILLIHFITLLGYAILLPFRLIIVSFLRFFLICKRIVNKLIKTVQLFFKKLISVIIYSLFRVYHRFISLLHASRKKAAVFILFIYSRLRIFKYPIISGIGIICAFILFSSIFNLPKVATINDFSLPSATLIYDRNNILLYSTYSSTYHAPIEINEVPQVLIDATVSAEDKHFFQHPGFDPFAIARALIHNVRNGSYERGLTITQQLAKNLYFTGEKSFAKKLKEAFITSQIELTHSKNEILELYFNTTSYGGVNIGVEAASQRYFGKKTKDLTVKEAVFIASLPIGPTTLLENNSNDIEERMNYVLRRMVEDKKITQEQKQMILQQDLHVLPQTAYKRAPHAVDYVLAQLEKEHGDMIKSGKGLIVHTSFDLQLQNYIQQKVLEQTSTYKPDDSTNAAVIVVQPKTGEILSLVGSVNYYDEKYGQYNAVTSPKQLGSAMKIVAYTYALEHGYQPNTIIADEPVYFKDYPDYYPKNYDNTFHGDVTLTNAFANSLNIPALKIAHQLGVDKIAQLGVKMGIPELNFQHKQIPLAFVLGGVDVSLEHLTQAYATVANDGIYHELNPITKITDYQQQIVYSKSTSEEKRILSSETAQNLYKILSDKNARVPMFGSSPQFDFGEATIAIKTDTSSDSPNNAAFAFSPDIVVGTWMGNTNNSSMLNVESGYVGVSSIMRDVTEQILINYKKNNSLTLNKN